MRGGILVISSSVSTSSVPFVEKVRIAHRATGIIRNFIGTLTVDAIGVALPAAGLLNTLLTAFIHVDSEFTFILNSARLLPALSKNPTRVSAHRTVTSAAPAA